MKALSETGKNKHVKITNIYAITIIFPKKCLLFARNLISLLHGIKLWKCI